jgi:virulence-associated protein VapD
MRGSPAKRKAAQRVSNVVTLDAPHHISNRPNWDSGKKGGRVYAIAFDLDQEMLQRHYHNESYKNAYDDIRRIFSRFGFARQQGSVYFGDEKVDPVRCVLAVQEVSKKCPWFKMAVIDIRMLRIEENNDLMPAVGDWELPLDSPEAAE